MLFSISFTELTGVGLKAMISLMKQTVKPDFPLLSTLSDLVYLLSSHILPHIPLTQIRCINHTNHPSSFTLHAYSSHCHFAL